MAMSENSKKIFEYLQSIGDENVTAAEIAEKLDLPKKTVDGAFTSAIQRKGYGFREEVPVVGGTVKYLKLTDEGKAFDINAPVDAE